MTIEEVGQLLVHMQAIDNRQIEEITILEWNESVGELDFSTAVEALRLHRRESRDWVTPFHIHANVERMRVAALGPQSDEWGNLIDPEPAALAAAQRVVGGMKAVTS